MKTTAFITQEYESDAAQSQFDKVMAAIAYDLDISIVFINQGVKQLQLNENWKCLNLYGITSIYVVTDDLDKKKDYLIKVERLTMTELKQLISESQLFI